MKRRSRKQPRLYKQPQPTWLSLLTLLALYPRALPPSTTMTTCTVYSADRAIGEFFNSSTTATRLQCDGFAVSHAGGVATSLAMQGVCSYTVTAGPNKSKIFQFRDEDSALNMDHITLAKATHPDFVASCKYHGTIGDLRPLHVYEMETLSGISQIIAGIPRDDISRQKNNVIDFTKYV